MKYTMLLFALLGGCASAITSQCDDDPYTVGENHGRYGFASQEQVYAAYCGTRFNAERYRAGWLDGNSERPAAAGM